MLTVAELKDIMDVGETISPANFEIVYDYGTGSILSVQDYGSYKQILSTTAGDTTSTYFVFFALGTGETNINYTNFMSALNGATDTDIVHYVHDSTTLPSVPIVPVSVIDAKFEVTTINSQTHTNEMTAKLTLANYFVVSSSSSSSV